MSASPVRPGRPGSRVRRHSRTDGGTAIRWDTIPENSTELCVRIVSHVIPSR